MFITMKHYTWLTLAFTSLLAQAQITPRADLQQQMQKEETAFLKAMLPGLQHKQMIAVRQAMQGNDAALSQIRASRNVAPILPSDIKSTPLTPTLTLFQSAEPKQGLRPVLLYLHGGGWCLGSINSCARFCAAVAKKANCYVVALNYRLAPQHSYPAPLDDCRMAFKYLKQHAGIFGGDTTRISIGGDSAGGNLAIATAMTEPSTHSIVPIYPVTELFTRSTPSWQSYAKGYGNDAELLEAFNEAYAAGQQQHSLVSVSLATDEQLQQLPPVLLLSAGHDILYDQTSAWAKRLLELKHPLQYHVFPTATHLFITVPGQPTAFSEAVKLTADFLQH